MGEKTSEFTDNNIKDNIKYIYKVLSYNSDVISSEDSNFAEIIYNGSAFFEE